MRRLIIFILLILIAIQGTLIFYPNLPKQYARQWILEHLEASGFPDSNLVISSLTLDKIVLENIQLDPFAINTITRIEATYSPFRLWYGQLDTIKISGADFTFSEDETSPRTKIFFDLGKLSLQSIPAQNVDLSDLHLSYGTSSIDISAAASLSLATEKNGEKKLVANIDSDQREASLSAVLTISETRDHHKKVSLDLDEGRIELPNLRLSRANGKMQIDVSSHGVPSVKGELNAGALRMGNIMLEGLSLIASGSSPDISIIGNAQFTDIPQTHVSLRVAESAQGARLGLQLSGTHPKELFDRILTNHPYEIPAVQTYALTADLVAPSLPQFLTPPFKGAVAAFLESPKPVIKVPFSCPRLNACNFTIEANAIDLSKEGALFAPLLAEHGVKSQTGHLAITGKGEISQDKKQTKILLDWLVRAKNLAFIWNGLPITNGNFTLIHKADGTMAIQDATASVLEGSGQIKNLKLEPNMHGAGTLLLRDINLEELGKLASVNGLSLSGKVDVELPLIVENNAILVQQTAKLSSKGTGTIKYQPKQYPSMLTGDDERIAILRQSLENYDFSDLQVDFSGDPTGTIKAKLNAKGTNKTLFANRPIHINLNIEGPLAPALQQFLPTLQAAETSTSGKDP